MSDTLQTESTAIRMGQPTIKAQQQQIEWAPISSGGQLSFKGTSYGAVKVALSMTFGKFPIRLKPEHLPQLKAMAAVAKESTNGDQPYTQLIEALGMYGNLELRDL